jgi:hypothetical protein
VCANVVNRNVPVSPGEDAYINVALRNIFLTRVLGPIIAGRVFLHRVHVAGTLAQDIDNGMTVFREILNGRGNVDTFHWFLLHKESITRHRKYAPAPQGDVRVAV